MPRFTHPGEKKALIILSLMGFIASSFMASKSWGLCENETGGMGKYFLVISEILTEVVSSWIRHRSKHQAHQRWPRPSLSRTLKRSYRRIMWVGETEKVKSHIMNYVSLKPCSIMTQQITNKCINSNGPYTNWIDHLINSPLKQTSWHSLVHFYF